MLTPISNFHLGVFSASADVGAVTSAFARGGWVVSETASLDDCARTTGDNGEASPRRWWGFAERLHRAGQIGEGFTGR